MAKRGHCLFCSHPKANHTGRPPEWAKAKYPAVRWSTSACSNPECACRRYET